MIGEGKMTPFAGEGQPIFMAIVFEFDTRKAIVKITTIGIAEDHMFNIGLPDPLLL